MARNDPFEADLHGLEPEKFVLLMRSLNERTMKLNEEGKQNGGRKGYLSRGRFLSRKREPRFFQSL